jgi:hypothetical protein
VPIIPALGRQKQEDHELESSPGNIARTCPKKRRKRKGRKREEEENRRRRRRRKKRRRERKRRTTFPGTMPHRSV